jgi:hypothetical protein
LPRLNLLLLLLATGGDGARGDHCPSVSCCLLSDLDLAPIAACFEVRTSDRASI